VVTVGFHEYQIEALVKLRQAELAKQAEAERLIRSAGQNGLTVGGLAARAAVFLAGAVSAKAGAAAGMAAGCGCAPAGSCCAA
jgi:hypothetical protein